MEKVQSGHRLVLTYNLIQTSNDSSAKASILDDRKSNLDRVLSSWRKDRQVDTLEPWEAVYMLDHAYFEANICLDHLKGKDQLRARYLVEACRDQDFCFYLAHFEFSKSGSCDSDAESGYHAMIDECERECRLKSLFMSDGQQLAERIGVEEEEVIQQDIFDEDEPDDEDVEGWTGNEGTEPPTSTTEAALW